MQIGGCQESPLPAECSSHRWGAALQRNMWDLVTEELVLLKWPESGHGWGTGFLQARGM